MIEIGKPLITKLIKSRAGDKYQLVDAENTEELRQLGLSTNEVKTWNTVRS